MMRYILLIPLILMMYGCSHKQYYILSRPHVIEKNTTEVSKTIAIADIALPEYLEMGKIPVLKANNQIIYLKDAFWAVDMGEDLTHALIFDLQKSFQNAKVRHYPWDGGTKADDKVFINIKRFIAYEHSVYMDAVISLNSTPKVVSLKVPTDMTNSAKIVESMQEAFFMLERIVFTLIDDISVSD